MDEWLKKVWVVILASIFGGTEPTKSFRDLIFYTTSFFSSCIFRYGLGSNEDDYSPKLVLSFFILVEIFFFRALRDKPTLLVLPQRLSTLSVDATTAELNWVCSFLIELCFTFHHFIVVYCDNVSATQLCSNLVFQDLLYFSNSDGF